MKRMSMVSAAVGLLAASMSWTGCNQSGQDSKSHVSEAQAPFTQSIQKVELKSGVADEEAQEKIASRFSDAKAYCLGMLLYAQKHGDLLPTNLDQTLPYLNAVNRLPSGTNHFDILYRGSLDKLPNPMTNGIIMLRSDACVAVDGKWTRVYGFADGHCETHSELDASFARWEKDHSLHP